MSSSVSRLDSCADFTEVEVSPLVSGLEEASPGLSMNVGSLLHQQLHVLLTASLYSDVERRLAWERRQHRENLQRN